MTYKYPLDEEIIKLKDMLGIITDKNRPHPEGTRVSRRAKNKKRCKCSNRRKKNE